MSVKQRRLKKEFSLSGKGLHTGKLVTAVLKPADENTGYVFVRTDVEPRVEIPALACNVKFVERSSCLEKDGLRIYTMEHCMAALYGCGIDNCIIELDGDEMPILDGSSTMYVKEIENVGIEEQNEERRYFEVSEKMEISNPETGASICLLPDNSYSVSVVVDYNSPYLPMQYASYKEGVDNFASDIANCRTFVFLRELEVLLANNLIKGGDLDNAIVIVDREVSKEEELRLKKQFGHEDVEIKNGVLNQNNLLFPNEPARHKLLDVIGDLALCGRFIKGRIIAEKPGHSTNNALSKAIYNKVQEQERADACPNIDINATPILDVKGIKELLPHRPPFLLVDKVLKMSENHIIGCKNVTMNEPFFVGHFPQEPVMPGVLIVEAMCQCGGVLVLNGVDDPENYSTYFLKIDDVKFRQKVVPGDTLIFNLYLTGPIRRGIVSMQGYAFVGKNLVCEGVFTAMVSKTKK